MARGDQLLRQWNLLKTLQTRGEGIALRELAREFEVSERTIQRDFEILQELGFPVEHDADEFGKRYWRMPHDFFRSGPLVLDLTEAVSLHLAGRLYHSLAGTHLGSGFDNVLAKIRRTLPRKALDHFSEISQTIHVRRVGRTDYSKKREIIRILEDSARSQTTVELEYHAAWRKERYTTAFNPYGLVVFEDDLFAVGWSHRAGAVRVLKATRIAKAGATGRTFRRPSDFDFVEHFRTSFGIIRAGGRPMEFAVRFRGAAAVLVEERIWHESQRLHAPEREESLFGLAEEAPDSVIATFRLADVVEFKRWIRSFGDLAVVLRPQWLREEMRLELLAAARQYGPETA